MDEDIFEIAKENDLNLDEAEDLQAFAEVSDLEPDEAWEVWQDL